MGFELELGSDPPSKTFIFEYIFLWSESAAGSAYAGRKQISKEYAITFVL